MSDGYAMAPPDCQREGKSACLIEVAERFEEHTGYYPERVLADQIYRIRGDRSYCKEREIRLSDPKLDMNILGISNHKNIQDL